MNNPSKIDLSAIEQDSQFRAELLYFLQMANTYIAQIFFLTFNDGKRLKQLYSWLEENKNNGWTQQEICKILYNNIVPTIDNKRSGYLDIYNADFTILLTRLNEKDSSLAGAGQRFCNNLRLKNAILRDLNSFCKDIDALREKRNYLKDYDNKKRQNKQNDERVIYALGLLLLPKLHQHLIGKINHANTRLRRQGLNYYTNEKPIILKLSSARKDRANATQILFGKRKKGVIDKKLRQDAQIAKETFMRNYYFLYPNGYGPKYNYHQFRIRQEFIGKINMRYIKNLLNLTEGKIHFSRDIEPIYNVAMEINNLLDRAFWLMQQEDESEEKRLKSEDGQTNRQAKTQMKEICCFNKSLRHLRNHIAHNGLFCFYKQGELSAQDVFSLIFTGFTQPHVRKSKQRIHELASQIENILNKQNVSWAFEKNPQGENKNPPPIVIKRWTLNNKTKYLNFNKYRLDRRQNIRKIFADWATSVKHSKNETLNNYIKAMRKNNES